MTRKVLRTLGSGEPVGGAVDGDEALGGAGQDHVEGTDAAEGVARYEPIGPKGEHHHHIVCESCGQVSAFEDSGLELAIEKLAGRVDYAIDAHDVTLRGECPACRGA